jgi:hypothetical protein
MARAFLVQHARSPSSPRHNEDRPGRTPQNTFGDRPLSRSLPTAAPVGAQDNDVGVSGVCVKNDDASRIAVLLLDSNLHASSFCAFPQLGQVLEPFSRAPREWNVRRGGVKDEQLGLAYNGQIKGAVKRPLACLLKIDGAEDTRKSAHATSQRNLQRRIRHRRPPARECEPRISVCDGGDTSARSRPIWFVALRSDLLGIATSNPHDRAALLSSRTPRSRTHESWNATGERSLPPVATPFVARTARPSSTLNCPGPQAAARMESDLCRCRRSGLVRLQQDDASARRSPVRSRGQIRERSLSFREVRR